MALISSREYGKAISNRAATCPQCGAPTGGFVSPRRRAIGAGILATLVAVFLIFAWLDHQAESRMREAEQAARSRSEPG